MTLPKYGLLEYLALYADFTFNSINDVCWQHKHGEQAGILLFLPLNPLFWRIHHDYARETRRIVCALEFCEQHQKLLIKGSIMLHEGLSVAMENSDPLAEMLIVELGKQQSYRFLQVVALSKSKVIETMPGNNHHKYERRYPRLDKEFDITYTLIFNVEHGPFVTRHITLKGESANVSKSGIFIKSEFLPPLGTPIKLLLQTQEGKVVPAQGYVVRREDRHVDSGFAVEISKGT